MKQLDGQLKPINAKIETLKSRVNVLQKSVSAQVCNFPLNYSLFILLYLKIILKEFLFV